MQIYNYSRTTGEFLSTSSARPDPLDIGKWLLPAQATTVAPPATEPGRCAVFSGGSWTTVEDYRQTPCWHKATAAPVTVDQLGPLPDALTTLAPPALYPLWTGSAWGLNTAAVATALIAAIDQLHQQYKYANFLHHGHYYYADEDALNDIERTSMRCARLADTDPIPTPPPVAGGWLTADRDAQGNRIIVTMTVADIHSLSDAIYDSRARLWGVRQQHVATLEHLAANGASLATLMAYDITTLWYQSEPE